MAQIGEVLKSLRFNFQAAVEGSNAGGAFCLTAIQFFDRAVADTLIDHLDGNPAEPAKPRRRRGPNKPKPEPTAE